LPLIFYELPGPTNAFLLNAAYVFGLSGNVHALSIRWSKKHIISATNHKLKSTFLGTPLHQFTYISVEFRQSPISDRGVVS